MTESQGSALPASTANGKAEPVAVVVAKRVLFRSTSVCSLQPQGGQQSSSSVAATAEVHHGRSSAHAVLQQHQESVATASAKSFTFGSGLQRTKSTEDALDDGPEFCPLLDIVDNAGSNGTLLSLVASALEATTDRVELDAAQWERPAGSSASPGGGQQASAAGPSSGAASSSGRLTLFHGVRPPPINLPAYLERIAKYTKCSPVCFVMALAYMDQVAVRDPSMLPMTLNVHRLVLTSVLLAAKFMDDHYFNNAFFARVGGVSVQELNRLELEMLRLLEYRLYVSMDLVRQYMRQLQSDTLVLGCPDNGFFAVGKKRRSVSGISHERRSHRRSSISDGSELHTDVEQHHQQQEQEQQPDQGGQLSHSQEQRSLDQQHQTEQSQQRHELGQEQHGGQQQEHGQEQLQQAFGVPC